MTEIKISGIRIVSKKNNRRNFRHISLPSVAYEKFKNLMFEYLYPFKGEITQPFKLELWYAIKGKFPQDIDNATTSILDVLQDYQVIENDNLCTEIHAYKTGEHKDWFFTIHLTEL